MKGTIGGVKTGCIAHRYKSLRPPRMESGLRLYDMEDITAMKLAAISDDGFRLKDLPSDPFFAGLHTPLFRTQIPLFECIGPGERPLVFR